jgi:hypothetical protein
MGSQKTLTNEKFLYYDKELPIYKTKKGVKLIKINNNYVNINNIGVIDKINNKTHNDIVAENIKELNSFDINDKDIPKDNDKDSNDANDITCISDSIDGEGYVIIHSVVDVS